MSTTLAKCATDDKKAFIFFFLININVAQAGLALARIVSAKPKKLKRMCSQLAARQ
jgi:phosphotransferase system  glucose/maltose/N-acetylglucosamine-specific IIC component